MPDLDIEAAADSIASDLSLTDDSREESFTEAPEVETPADVSHVEQELSMPKSWKAEHSDLWKSVPRAAQEVYNTRELQMLEGLKQYQERASYGENLYKAFQPYQDILKKQGLDEVKAVQYLLNAHNKLSDVDLNKRATYFRELAGLYGVNLGENSAQNPQNDQITHLLNEFGGIKSKLEAFESRNAAEMQSKVRSEVDTFAFDPKNAYFDEVSEDIVVFINAGMGLEDAYQKAVWANPVTRQKEIARIQQEESDKLRERAKEEVKVAKRGISTNVNSRDTAKAPTESAGKWDDDKNLRESLKSIRDRSS